MRKCLHVMPMVLSVLLLVFTVYREFEHQNVTRALEHANELSTAASAYWKGEYYGLLYQKLEMNLAVRNIQDAKDALQGELTAAVMEREQKNLEIAQLRDYHKSMKIEQTAVASVSAYNPTVKQCGPNPFTTAKGTRVRPGIVAVSPDLYRKGWTFGKKVGIGEKVYIIEDMMGADSKNVIDIFMWHAPDALAFGRKTIKVALLTEKNS